WNRVYGAVYIGRFAGRFLHFLRLQRPYLLMDPEILGNTRSDTARWCFQNTAHAVLFPKKPAMVASGRQGTPQAPPLPAKAVHPYRWRIRMKLLQRVTPVAMAFGALLLAAAAQAADTIKIGIPQPMTGPNTEYGAQIQGG